MEEKKAKPGPSLGDVAKAAGISKTSAGCALRNLPGVSPETRKRVLQIAERLHYFPDPLLSSQMLGIRKTVAKDLLPIVWLNSNKEKDAWHKYNFLSPYMEGARGRFHFLGYRIEEIWTKDPDISMRRISQIIDHQGIMGVIASDPLRHLQLKWDRLAGVSIGGGLLAPKLHRVAANNRFNLDLALKMARRFGYERIGLCLTEEADRFSHHDARATISYFNSTIPRSQQVKPLFTEYTIKPPRDVDVVCAWIRKERPDAVIGHSCDLVNWANAAGLRVPEDIGVIHLAIEDDVLDWSGVYANKREIGRVAADRLVSLIQHGEFGIPPIASATLIPGTWRSGNTLLVSKTKAQKGRRG
jgi:LacI family transcriptional regulator